MLRPPARITRAGSGSSSTMARRLDEMVFEDHLDERTTGEGVSVILSDERRRIPTQSVIGSETEKVIKKSRKESMPPQPKI